MCGIAGFIGQGDKTVLTQMTDSIIYRGPDDEGVYYDSKYNLYLGHRRLSILDIPGGIQPMMDSQQRVSIVFNGEIYNYKEIRKELENKGFHFRSDHSDTEVILNAYLAWGEKCVDRFNGMWSIAIHDIEKSKLFISRDRFGKKPLFYTLQNGNFVFGSELHLFKIYPYVDTNESNMSLKKYFAYGYIPSPNTLYDEVYKLPGGHNLIFDLNTQQYKVKKYWDFQIEPFESLPKNPVEYFSEEIISLLSKSIQRRMVSDVPLGIFLSGGVDSSAIVALASDHLKEQKLKTFSIGFEEASFDESKYAKEVAELYNTQHFVDVLSIDKALEIIPKVLSQLDEPMGDSSILPTYLLSNFTRKHVTVALTGDGGDELFAGYDPFLALKTANIYNKIVPRPIHEGIRHLMTYLPVSHNNMSLDFKIKRTLRGLSYSKKLWTSVWMAPLSLGEINNLFGDKTDIEELYSEAIVSWDDCKEEALVDKVLSFYTKLYLQDDILVKSDRASMMNSLEVRAPFLDIDFVDFVRKIPWQYKYHNGETKYILKKALESYLPKNILYRKKKGFGVPVGKWFKEKSICVETEYINTMSHDFIEKKINSHINGISDERAFLWSLLALKI